MKWYWVAGTRTKGLDVVGVGGGDQVAHGLDAPAGVLHVVHNEFGASLGREAGNARGQNSKVMVPMAVPPSLRVRLTFIGFHPIAR